MPASRKPRTSSNPGAKSRAKPSAKTKQQGAKDEQAPPFISFGPEICTDLAASEQREWLVTNGIGGFASGTIAGLATRRYHGLLFAALNPPAGRTLLVGGFDELLRVGDQTFALATHRWLSGVIAPEGYKLLQDFRLEGSIPVWTYQVGAVHLEKRVWMQHAENTTYVRYTLLQSPSPVDLELKSLVNYRDFHSATHAGFPPNEWRMHVDPVDSGVQINAFGAAAPFYLKSAGATCEPQHIWYRDFFFHIERERGLDDHEDQLHAAIFHARLEKGQSITIICSTNPEAALDGEAALKGEQDGQVQILAASPTKSAPPWFSQLLLGADQFIVQRPIADQPEGKSIIAGYHWFGDWGRDTMIALPGLALTTGRPEIARQILLAFSRLVNGGMLPNNFPDAGGAPEYNTIDATLWYFEAIRQYFAATQDVATLRELFSVLQQIIAAHLEGTRYNIHVDPADGLLYGGGPGAQLTWMDAKVDGWVVTPRTGKPVEVNALWINALESMAAFAETLEENTAPYKDHAARARAGFAKFWNPQRNCCFDVIDCPGIGNDASLRPNQIFAVSLPVSPLSEQQQKAVVDACAAHLLTPVGLRSLAPGEPGYAGSYWGGPRERDSAYHQGTVWTWLLGPFALAHFRVHKDRDAALALLAPLAAAMDSYGVGTLPELYTGDAPHHPRGCIAQAWTVAEVLRAWHALAV